MESVLQVVRLFVSAGYTRPVLALHHALVASSAAPCVGLDAEAERARMTALRAEVESMVRTSAREWAHCYVDSPGVGLAAHYGGRAEPWAEVLLEEAKEKGPDGELREELTS